MIVLFDLDDTLLDQKEAMNIAAQLFLHEFSDRLPYDEKNFPKIWQEVMQKYIPLFSEGKISFQDQRRLRMREIFHQPDISDEEADRRFAIYLGHFEANWRLFNDVVPCLDSLNHYQLGVVTNGNGMQQRQKLDQLGLKKYFTNVVISEEVGFSKPKQEIFWAANTQFGCTPSDCVFVGDSLENDVIGSNRAGMQGIWLNRDKKQFDDGNIITIYGLDELKAKVECIFSERQGGLTSR